MINQSQLTPQIQVDGVNPIPNATVDNPTGDRVAYINDYEVSAVKTYSSSKITALISGLEGFSIKVVAELPASGDTKALYLTPSSNTAVTNVYDEYVYVQNAWEKVGSTSVDLSNYYTKSQTYSKSEVDSMHTDMEYHSTITQAEYNALSDEEKADYKKIRIISEDEGATYSKAYIGNFQLTTGSTGGVTAADLELDESVIAEGVVNNRSQINTKQPVLVGGLNIKNINSGSIVGSGNIDLTTPLKLDAKGNKYYMRETIDEATAIINEALYNLNQRLTTLEA